MRRTIDLPDPLLRQLKSRAALEGTTLRQLLRTALERGRGAGPAPRIEMQGHGTPPSLRLGRPVQAKRFSNAALCELLDE